MNAWVEWFNATSSTWANHFWMATWQAVIVIAIAWLLTTLLYRLSPRVRSWIWRLAYVKILLSLFWTTPIELALLPPMEGRGARGEEREIVAAKVAGQESAVRSQVAEVSEGSEVKDSKFDETPIPQQQAIATSVTPARWPSKMPGRPAGSGWVIFAGNLLVEPPIFPAKTPNYPKFGAKLNFS